MLCFVLRIVIIVKEVNAVKLYAPRYYTEFVCLADRCSHSCCIGWEIDVDEQTRKRYELLTEGYGKTIVDTIEVGDTPHFKLDKDERCPHLDERGLCRIITALGEEYLCDICREHPRFYNETARGMEVGLGMACEEACRLILNADDYQTMVEVGECEGEAEGLPVDTLAHRDDVYRILADHAVSYSERLYRIGQTYGVSPSSISDERWRNCLQKLEYMDDAHKERMLCYSSELSTPAEAEDRLERALGYFVYRHCAEVYTEEEFRLSLGFCLFCERLLASLVKNGGDVADVARMLSEEMEYSDENVQAIEDVFFDSLSMRVVL